MLEGEGRHVVAEHVTAEIPPLGIFPTGFIGAVSCGLLDDRHGIEVVEKHLWLEVEQIVRAALLGSDEKWIFQRDVGQMGRFRKFSDLKWCRNCRFVSLGLRGAAKGKGRGEGDLLISVSCFRRDDREGVISVVNFYEVRIRFPRNRGAIWAKNRERRRALIQDLFQRDGIHIRGDNLFVRYGTAVVAEEGTYLGGSDGRIKELELIKSLFKDCNFNCMHDLYAAYKQIRDTDVAERVQLTRGNCFRA